MVGEAEYATYRGSLHYKSPGSLDTARTTLSRALPAQLQQAENEVAHLKSQIAQTRIHIAEDERARDTFAKGIERKAAAAKAEDKADYEAMLARIRAYR